MPRYAVRVRYEQEREINVWARDESSAMEKAAEIVEGWNGVLTAEGMDAEESDE